MTNQIIIDELERKFQEYRELSKPLYTPRENEINQAPQVVSTIIGARRSGKSYRLLQVIDDAIAQRLIPNNNHVCHIDFDHPVFALMQAMQLNLITTHFLKSNVGFSINTPIIFVFDEIQKIQGWEQYVIELSRNIGWRVFVTGSSARMLRGDISTSLRGKAVSTIIYPFSFSEFVNHHQVDAQSRSSAGQASIMRLFDQYLRWGGFPVMSQLDEKLRDTILNEYFDTMLLKDIIERYNVSKPQQCVYLLRFLLSNISKPFTQSSAYEALKSTGMPTSKDSVADYIEWARDSFLCYTIPLLSGSIKEQTRNYQKLYAIDWALSSANNWVWDGRHSRSLENMVFLQLLRSGKKINYYLTREKRQEIDFVVSNNNGKVEYLIQACWSLSDNTVVKRETEPLSIAMEYFGLNAATIVTSNESDEIKLGHGTIKAVPAWKWLLEKF